MNMKPWTKARECAKVVVWNAKSAGGVNRLYNLAYWGKAMRAHMAYIKEEGLEGHLTPEVARLVAKAEEALVEHCEGKDCSFQAG
jgi:hypothetical protein